MLFNKKENMVPAGLKARSKANITDFFIFLVLVIVLVNNGSLNSSLKIITALSYVIIIIPLMMTFLGTPGQLYAGIRIKRNNDHSKNISINSAYYRMLLLLISSFIGILGLKKKSNIEELSNSLALEPDVESNEEEIKKYKNQKAKTNFIIATLIYIGFVIWLGSYWLLIGLPVIYDIYITKKVNWTPWKKREGTNHWLIEWLDALIFAVVAVSLINIFLFQNYKIPTGSMEKSLLIGDHLYVSKIAYGPRIPNTPLSIPFMQHTIPGSLSKSYSDLIQWPYKRLAGFSKVKRDDPVVFNFPAGDTVCLDMQSVSFYYIIREEVNNLKMMDQYTKQPLKPDNEYYKLGREKVLKEHEIVVRPVDKRDNYIKRCVAIAGDTLQIIDGIVYINGQKQKEIPGIQYMYAVQTDGRILNAKKLQQMGIYESDITYEQGVLKAPLTTEMAAELKNNKLVSHIERLKQQNEYFNYQIFPNDIRYPWNLDQFGPLYIPKKGVTISITLNNLPIYERIIGYYEHNVLQVKDSTIYINNQPATTYTFKMDYYWMMGDNRHNSLDSRYWGFVPEDHIVGKPQFVWLSLNKEKKFPGNIRFNRMFMKIK
jgi:signal peptidase I